MKKLFLLGLAIILFTACQQQPERYTTTSTNIDEVKSLISDYHDGNWEAWASHYSDTAKIYHNTWKTGASVKETSESLKTILANMSGYHFDEGEDEIFYEEIISDKGMTWVHFWGLWRGTLAANNQELEIPVHIAMNMVEGKIALEYGFYNISEFTLALQAIETAKAAAEAEALETTE